MIDAGTSLTIAALAPAGPALDVVVAADELLVVDDEEDELLLLLLPQPTVAAAHINGTAADSHVLVLIALLLIDGSPRNHRQHRQHRPGPRPSEASLTKA
ncbi:MAG: hypothetical protein WAL63_20035 [Solirubrobacteraceae bacterium]